MTKKRAKGDGGLGQRHDHPTCPPLVDGVRPTHPCRGRWVATLNVELPNGNLRRRSFYGRTQQEAKKKLDAARREKATGTLVASSPTVEQWMNDWLAARRKPPKALKPNTWNGYESKVRLYITPALGKRHLDQLRPQQVDALYAEMRERGLSEATIRQTHAILQKALADAVRKGRLGRSPMDRVDSPGTETEKREQWTLEQSVRALRAAGDSLRWWLAVFYGMRQGEVLGLRWEDVDLERGLMRIEQTRQSDYGYRGYIMGDPKSRAGKRELPMVGQIKARTLLHWEAQGRPLTGLVFPNGVGKPLDPKRDWAEWRAFIDTATVVPLAPLPYIALHAARGTAASLMEAAGIPDRVVAQILGQATVSTTHGYQQAEAERIRAYMERVDGLLELG